METSSPLSQIQTGNATIVEFGQELSQIDELNVTDIGHTLLEIADNLSPPILILDMTQVEFFGSSFIEVLFRVWKRVAAKPGARLGIAGIQPYCRDVLRVTHVDSLWEIFSTCQVACETFEKTLAAGR